MSGKTEIDSFDNVPFGGMCPSCDHEVEFYDTNKKQDGGRYRCGNCGRDTVWKVVKTYTIQEILEKTKRRALRSMIKEVN